MRTKLLFLIVMGAFLGSATSLFAAEHQIGDLWTEPHTGMEFVYVPGGCFQMGDIFGGRSTDMRPVHEVCVNDFFMSKYEVTQKEWQAVTGLSISQQRDKAGAEAPLYGVGDDLPAYYVSWSDTQEFIRGLSSESGLSFRLPTEAEWEYAARSAGKSERYAGGLSEDTVAWHLKNSGGKVHPVGSKQPNGLGLYDMSGNALEWTNDFYDRNYYKKSPKLNPQGVSVGRDRSHRGGSWLRDPGDALTVYRGCRAPERRKAEQGLRLLLPAGQLD